MTAKQPAKPVPKKKPAAKKAPPKPRAGIDVLAPMQREFVRQYCIDRNASAAAMRAGYSKATAGVQGYQLLQKPLITAAIAELEAKSAERVGITQDMVLKRMWDIATANPNEIMQFRRGACRQCYGVEHNYQWVNRAELKAHHTKWEAAQANKGALDNLSGRMLMEFLALISSPEPTDEGGFGYDRLMLPADNCPACRGEGEADVHINDTRNLAAGAAALFAGVKQTREGLEIKLHDQAKALENVARHLGMFKEQHNHDFSDPMKEMLKRMMGQQTALSPVANPDGKDD